MKTNTLYLDSKAAARLIGRTPGAVRQLALRRMIPHRRQGGRLIFIENELRAWIEEAPGVRLSDLQHGPAR